MAAAGWERLHVTIVQVAPVAAVLGRGTGARPARGRRADAVGRLALADARPRRRRRRARRDPHRTAGRRLRHAVPRRPSRWASAGSASRASGAASPRSTWRRQPAGAGIGSAVMRALLDWAQQRGATVVVPAGAGGQRRGAAAVRRARLRHPPPVRLPRPGRVPDGLTTDPCQTVGSGRSSTACPQAVTRRPRDSCACPARRGLVAPWRGAGRSIARSVADGPWHRLLGAGPSSETVPTSAARPRFARWLSSPAPTDRTRRRPRPSSRRPRACAAADVGQSSEEVRPIPSHVHRRDPPGLRSSEAPRPGDPPGRPHLGNERTLGSDTRSLLGRGSGQQRCGLPGVGVAEWAVRVFARRGRVVAEAPAAVGLALVLAAERPEVDADGLPPRRQPAGVRHVAVRGPARSDAPPSSAPRRSSGAAVIDLHDSASAYRAAGLGRGQPGQPGSTASSTRAASRRVIGPGPTGCQRGGSIRSRTATAIRAHAVAVRRLRGP